MRYWWVNQKQTHVHEIGGGYLWSPKRSKTGRNQFYENMRIVVPGDVVFSYWETSVRAYGIARSFGYDAPKPDEFGDAGRNWDAIGYRVDVDYVPLTTPIAPRQWLERIRPLLPNKYSPLHPETGKGLQSVYLAALPDALGQLLWNLLLDAHNPMLAADTHAQMVRSAEERERDAWEAHEVQRLDEAAIPSTDRQAIIKARRGQGKFRENVASVELACRITRVSNPAYLLASHIKPWRHASNAERLSGQNGLMLAPQADYLFDRGFISFSDGRLLISEVAHEESLLKLGIDPMKRLEVGTFSDKQERFLEFHRAEIFRTARVL